MCTSITINTNNNDVILGRTFDWSVSEKYKVIVAPRNYEWTAKSSSEHFDSKFAFIGLAVEFPIIEHPIFVDGVNEKGLMCATLWLNDSSYSPYEEGKINLESYDIVLWILSQFSSVDDVLRNISSLNILDSMYTELSFPITLHWIINDKSGKSVIIEKTKLGLQIYTDSIGTLTNDPLYYKHLNNLEPYLPFDITIFNSKRFPGDFSPSSRFIRAALLRQSIKNASNESEGILNVYKILQNVSEKDETALFLPDSKIYFYTLYTTAMCANSGNYYATTYRNNQINKFNLFHEDLTSSKLIKFELSEEQAYNKRN
ncbi:MAG TPA: hypothetical protein DG753_10880 [Clostridium sp.]|nr:hypothetical protein [Clostridium sp.]